MDRKQLEELIQRMNIHDESGGQGSSSTSWIAHRQAEKLSDKSLLPMLEEMINTNQGESKKDIRSAAYFIYEKILYNNVDIDEKRIQFLLHQMEIETDQWVIESILTEFWDIKVLPDTKLTPIIEYVKSTHNQRALIAIRDFADQGNKEAKEAYPMLEKSVEEAMKTPREAILSILKDFGINTEKDLEKLDDEESAVLYETLKAGVMEEYDMSWKKVCRILDKIFD